MSLTAKITASIYIAPHERHEAIDVWSDMIPPEQLDEIDEAPENAVIVLQFCKGEKYATVKIIEES